MSPPVWAHLSLAAVANPDPAILSALQSSDTTAAAKALVDAATSGSPAAKDSMNSTGVRPVHSVASAEAGAAVSQAAAANPQAVANATAAAAVKDVNATAAVLASAQAQAATAGQANALARSTVSAISVAGEGGRQAVQQAVAQVCMCRLDGSCARAHVKLQLACSSHRYTFIRTVPYSLQPASHADPLAQAARLDTAPDVFLAAASSGYCRVCSQQSICCCSSVV